MSQEHASSLLYCCARCDRFPVENGRVLLTGYAGKSKEVLPTPVADLLFQCQDFKSLKDHAQWAWKNLSFWKQRKYWKAIIECYSKYYGSLIIGPRCFVRMLEGIFERLSERKIFISMRKK